jgi:hypothetical protein
LPRSASVLGHPLAVRRWLVLLCAALLLATTAGLASARPAEAGPPAHRDQLRFMWAMAGQESGWDYYARNETSGAFGKYQIMPFNWPVWAEEYLGDRRADQTPFNQEKVAYGKIHDLYRWLGSWKRVAYWWLTGRTDRNAKTWSSYASGYVDNIMRLRKRAPRESSVVPPRTSSQSSRGDWRRAADDHRLRLAVGGRVWPSRGRIRDGQVLKVKAAKSTARGERWVKVATADVRIGWIKQLQTVPARKPGSPARWNGATDDGGGKRDRDRKQVRPRPR